MKKKYLDNFYKTTAPHKQYAPFAIALPITLLHKSMNNDTEQFLKENYDLLHSDIDVLATLYFNGNVLSPTELYDAMLFSSGGMTKILKKLETREYIAREANKYDKRSLLVCITPLGKAIVEESLQTISIRKTKFFSILSEEEKNNLIKILEKLTRQLVSE